VRRALAVVAAALLLPAGAVAHITISPPFVENGVETDISLTVPNERPPHVTVAVAVSAPPGVAIVAADAPAGWRSVVEGSTVTWSGGRIAQRDQLVLPLRVLARTRAGTTSLAARQTYDDGAAVRWAADLGVLPATGTAAPGERPWAAITAAIIGVVVIAGSLLLARMLRRDHSR
jgi:Domain of unkown function (DUF1775)